jgi:hypothetical protein
VALLVRAGCLAFVQANYNAFWHHQQTGREQRLTALAVVQCFTYSKELQESRIEELVDLTAALSAGATCCRAAARREAAPCSNLVRLQ